MLELRGRKESRFPPLLLRRVHKTAGYLFVLLFLLIGYFCIALLVSSRQELSSRAVFHAIFALGLFVVLTAKILIVRLYRQFMGSIHKFGLAVFLLAFGAVATSAGHFFPVASSHYTKPKELRSEVETESPGWSLLQVKCTRCHTLERIFSKSRTTVDWTRLVGLMRSFLPGWISDEEAAQITDYLYTNVCGVSDTTGGR